MIRPNIGRVVGVIALVVLVASLALAGASRAATPVPAEHASHHASATPSVSDSTASASDGMMSMTTMGTPGAGMPMGQSFDLMYLDMTIRHNQAEIAMSEVAVSRAEREEIRDFARNMITMRQAEIEQLRVWRDAWYPGAPEMPVESMMGMMLGMTGMMGTPSAGMPGMDGMMGTPGAGMPGMDGMMGTPSAGMPGMDGMMGTPGAGMPGMDGMMGTPGAGMPGMDGMMGMMDPQACAQGLRDASGPFDLTYLQMMVPHRQMAIMLARIALQQATQPEIKQFAQAVIESRESEIERIQDWIAAWFPATPGASDAVIDVEVTLSEFKIMSALTDFQVGVSYRFVVTNTGAVPHEFMIMPIMEGIGQMDMETLDEMAIVMIPADDLPPGGTGSVEVTFNQENVGLLQFVCAAPAHYDAGMKLQISVGV